MMRLLHSTTSNKKQKGAQHVDFWRIINNKKKLYIQPTRMHLADILIINVCCIHTGCIPCFRRGRFLNTFRHRLECFGNFLDCLIILYFYKAINLFLKLLYIFSRSLNILSGFIMSQSEFFPPEIIKSLEIFFMF